MSKPDNPSARLQNRLEIIIQAVLDYLEEGGDAAFWLEEDSLFIEMPQVWEVDGRFLTDPIPAETTAVPLPPPNDAPAVTQAAGGGGTISGDSALWQE